MNRESLLKNISNQIVECQIKSGYAKEIPEKIIRR